MRVKETMWLGYTQGVYRLVCKSNPYGKVLTFVENGKEDPTPWQTWARVFQIFGPHGWRVGFFPSELKRILPAPGESVGPEHVNGGYAYPCRPNSIIVYREEEATRVLIHELFHAACTDRHLCLEENESETEAWAELVLVALVSEGDLGKAKKAFAKQLRWMGETHATLRKFYGIESKEDYIWRYTLGREAAYKRLGVEVPEVAIKKPRTSSRLTHPDLEI